MILIKPRTPETFQEAMRVRDEICQLFQQAMLETDQRRLAWLIDCVKHRLDLLPLIRHHFDAEIRRLESETVAEMQTRLVTFFPELISKTKR